MTNDEAEIIKTLDCGSDTVEGCGNDSNGKSSGKR
jgi:hypothetical protein